MTTYDNSGALFRNNQKASDNHPDHTGSATIAGVDYYLDAWINEKNGRKYFRIKFKPKQQQAAPSQPAQDDEDVPF